MNRKPRPTRNPGGRRERLAGPPPVEAEETLLEDLADLAALAGRRDEPTVTHEALVRRLRADGLL